jgi:hypothetical protein
MVDLTENVKITRKKRLLCLYGSKDTFWSCLETPMVEAYQVPYQQIYLLSDRFYDPHRWY